MPTLEEIEGRLREITEQEEKLKRRVAETIRANERTIQNSGLKIRLGFILEGDKREHCVLDGEILVEPKAYGNQIGHHLGFYVPGFASYLLAFTDSSTIIPPRIMQCPRCHCTYSFPFTDQEISELRKRQSMVRYASFAA